jgi:hypothetical protein
MKKYPGKSCMPLVSMTADPEYAKGWVREGTGYVFRITVPRSRTAASVQEVKGSTVMFKNLGDAGKPWPESEWLTNGERLPPKYVAGYFDMQTGEYVPNGDHPANAGFDPQLLSDSLRREAPVQ